MKLVLVATGIMFYQELVAQRILFGLEAEVEGSHLDGFKGRSWAPLPINPSGIFAIKSTQFIKTKVGGYGKFNFRSWFIQPSIMLSINHIYLERDYDYYIRYSPYYYPTIYFNSAEQNRINNSSLLGLEIPILIGKSFFSNRIRFEAGPVFSLYTIQAETVLEELYDDQNIFLTSYKEKITNEHLFNKGVQVGLAFTKGKFTARIKYSYSQLDLKFKGVNPLLDLDNSITIPSVRTFVRSIGFNLNYKLQRIR